MMRGFPRHRRIHKHKDICDGATTCGTLLMDSSITSPDSNLLTSFTWNPAVASIFRATVSIRWFLPLLCVCVRARVPASMVPVVSCGTTDPLPAVFVSMFCIFSPCVRSVISFPFFIPSGCCTQRACSLKILSAAFADLMIGWHMSESKAAASKPRRASSISKPWRSVLTLPYSSSSNCNHNAGGGQCSMRCLHSAE